MARAVPHLHISYIHVVMTFLEVLIVWIPLKIVAARFEGRGALPSAILNVL